MALAKQIVVGKITSAFGVKGWVKVLSFTDPKENILRFSPWSLKRQDKNKLVKIVEGKPLGRLLAVHLQDFSNRDQAETIAGWEILISREQLPDTKCDVYYWSDLMGLHVINQESVNFGVVENIIETGANDVLLVKGDRDRAIPFIMGQIVKNVDLNEGLMIVDWDPDF